jgi:hypothetical protein
MPVEAMLASRRFWYGFVSTNFSGSIDRRSVSNSSHFSSSNRILRRSTALMRK